MKSYREAGEGRLGAIIWLGILIFVGLSAYEWVPLRVKVAELEDHMVDLTQRAHNVPVKAIKKDILTRAEELGIPLTKDNLDVQYVAGRIKMNAEYILPVDLPFYTFNWKVDHKVDRPVFVI
ncbi:MAG: hypothetical protein AAGA81_01115 [Acidobacteriota bacterium]